MEENNKKQLRIATIGHIDEHKTTLVEAIAKGISTDRNLLNKVSVKGNLLNDLLRYCKLEEVRNNKFYGK